jgi:hypothetical protein
MKFKSFAEFYPFYLSEHRDPTCRRLHFIGNCLVLVVIFTAIFERNWWLLCLAPVVGYGFAWIGHFFFEHNKPATFNQPFYSFLGDWKMMLDILTGRQKF